mgnify:CR=1 FL=1
MSPDPEDSIELPELEGSQNNDNDRTSDLLNIGMKIKQIESVIITDKSRHKAMRC